MTDYSQLPLLQQAETHLTNFIGNLTGIANLLTPYQSGVDLLANTPSREVLSQYLGISLTVGDGLTDEDWSADRLNEAYRAVRDIINALAGKIFNGDFLFGLIQFLETFGGTEIRLTAGSFEGSASYASTSDDGGVIYLYAAPSLLLRSDLERCAEGLGKSRDQVTMDECAEAGYTLHSAENIVHEFGHVLVFRAGKDASEIYQEWNKIRNLINPFDTTMGWDDDTFKLLQNRSTLEDVKLGNISASELEHERLANMFQAFVYGYQPILDASQCDEDILNCGKRRAAWAMWSFMTGECPPDEVFVGYGKPPCGQGVKSLKDWLQE